MNAGDQLVKTWQIRNAGTCTWTPLYNLVLVDGEAMGASAYMIFDQNVPPGAMANISIAITIPNRIGSLQTFWQIEAENGERFGVGVDGTSPLWVKVNIEPSPSAFTPEPATTPPTGLPTAVIAPSPESGEFVLDLYSQYCDAAWFADELPIPCQGVESGQQTAAIFQQAQAFSETNQMAGQVLIVQLPLSDTETRISAIFPEVLIQNGDRLILGTGCAQDAFKCSVLFSIFYMDSTGQQNPIWTIGEFHDGQLSDHTIDLSHLSGTPVRLRLEVSSLGPSDDDIAMWIAPRIIRQPQPTETMEISPTAIVAETAASTASATPIVPRPTEPSIAPPPSSLLDKFIDAFVEFLKSLWGGR